MSLLPLCMELVRATAVNVWVIQDPNPANLWLTDDAMFVLQIVLFHVHIPLIALGVSWSKPYAILQLILSAFAVTVLVNNEVAIFRPLLVIMNCYVTVSTLRKNKDVEVDLRVLVPVEHLLLLGFGATIARYIDLISTCSYPLWYMHLGVALLANTHFM